MSEYESRGFVVRGTIVTHLATMTADAEASAGSIRIIPKDVVFALWEHVKLVLSFYRDNWSLHDFNARKSAAQSIRAKLPNTGWLIRALDSDERFISADHLLAEWFE